MLENVANTVTDEPVELSIDVLPQGWLHRLMLKFEIIKKKRVFKLRQITMGNLIRISRLILSVDKIDFTDQEKILEKAMESMAKSGDNISEIVAIAIYNQRASPPASLVKFVKSNFTASELKYVIAIVLKQMNVQDFIISIVSVKGAQILKTSPEDQGS